VTMSITNEEAKNEVEEKLRKQQLTKPMTEMEMAVFCQAMLRNLELKSESALSDIRGWSENLAVQVVSAAPKMTDKWKESFIVKDAAVLRASGDPLDLA